MPCALSVNLNKIALIRNSREGNFPDVSEFGRICLEQGAQGLTVHPRPDQRHIRPQDVFSLAALVADFDTCEFNIEGNPFAAPLNDYPGLLALAQQTSPQQCTLVPDSNTQLTSDHGFDLTSDSERLLPIIEQLHAWGIRVSLFMDPNPEQIALAQKIGADRIELYTGPYADACLHRTPELDSVFQHYYDAAKVARELGLGVNAGHDLNLDNLPRFLTIPGIEEVSIGHAFTVDSLKMGMPVAVGKYLAACKLADDI